MIPVEIQGLHGKQVDDSTKICFQTDRQLHRQCVVPQFVLELGDDTGRIGTASVAFVDKGNARDMVSLHLLIHRDGLRLDTADGTEHEYGTVQNAQRTFHLDREINVSGCIDDVDFMVAPFAKGGRRSNGYPSLLLQLHRVHRCTHSVFSLDVVNGVDPLGVK